MLWMDIGLPSLAAISSMQDFLTDPGLPSSHISIPLTATSVGNGAFGTTPFATTSSQLARGAGSGGQAGVVDHTFMGNIRKAIIRFLGQPELVAGHDGGQLHRAKMHFIHDRKARF